MTAATGIVASSLIGSAASAYGQQQAGEFNKRIADFNANVADQQAVGAKKRGIVAEEQSLLKTRQLIGAQRARFAAQGISADVGSALDVTSDTQRIGQLDALTIRNNAALEAWGYRVQSADATMHGQLAQLEGNLGAASTLITGGTQAAYMGYELRSPGTVSSNNAMIKGDGY